MAGVCAATTDLFAGVDAIINARLGVVNYRTKTATKTLVARAPGALDGEGLVEALFETLRENWHRALPSAKASHQNFRWHCPQLTLAQQNTSPEVTLERAFNLNSATANLRRRDSNRYIPFSKLAFETAREFRGISFENRTRDFHAKWLSESIRHRDFHANSKSALASSKPLQRLHCSERNAPSGWTPPIHCLIELGLC